MYKIRISDRTWIHHEGELKKIETSHDYNCDTLQRFLALIESIVETSDGPIDCMLAKIEEEDTE